MTCPTRLVTLCGMTIHNLEDHLGKVYDVDAPGTGNVPADPVNTIARLRANFRQWAISGSQKVSDDMNWFSRISVIKTANGDVLSNEIAGDNVAGIGTTNLSWNLQ